MKKETYLSQKAFAGAKKASMKRRFVGHDYTDRQMYMVTMAVEDRRPLLGTIVGRSDAPADSKDAPKVELTELGQRVYDEWWGIPNYYPQIEIKALQIMPDHLHGIIFIKEKMEKDLSRVLRGFKTGCNRAYRELCPSVQYVVTQSQQTGQQPLKKNRRGEDRSHGLLFEPGFNDKLLLREGQLQRWNRYLHDNPRRLLMKRERPELMRPFFNLQLGSHRYNGIGNRALLTTPQRMAVRISRRLTAEQLDAEVARYIEAARSGTILISPAISPGEKRVMRQAFDLQLPTIVVLRNGFTPLSKPHGEQFDACAEGRLLMLSAWDHTNERITLTASDCQQMNLMALELSKL
jgi:REP element-mobilizing transposase RayT